MLARSAQASLCHRLGSSEAKFIFWDIFVFSIGETPPLERIVVQRISPSFLTHCIPVKSSSHKVLTEYRAVSGVFRTIDPPPPLHPASVSSPRPKGVGVHTRRAVRGWGGGSIFRKTPDIGLASYIIIPLRFIPKCVAEIRSRGLP